MIFEDFKTSKMSLRTASSNSISILYCAVISTCASAGTKEYTEHALKLFEDLDDNVNESESESLNNIWALL